MSGRLTHAGIARVANRIGCEEAAIRAVIAVESNGGGFLADARPRILFEAHIFSRETGGAFDRTHPKLSSKSWNRDLYVGGVGEYYRLYQAAQLHGEAAVKACSWGLMQIMGFNWQACGEKSLTGFLLAMHNNEDAHLALFSEFVSSQGIAGDLRRRDWAAFARKYNGPGYAANAYDKKLAAAYDTARGAK